MKPNFALETQADRCISLLCYPRTEDMTYYKGIEAGILALEMTGIISDDFNPMARSRTSTGTSFLPIEAGLCPLSPSLDELLYFRVHGFRR